MEYLIKFSAIITLFYICYKVLLEGETFFEANRWFLLIGIITAFLLPCLTITSYIEEVPIAIANFEFSETVTVLPTKRSINWLLILNTTYFIGVFIFTVRYILQVTSLIKLLSKNKSQQKEGFRYISTSASISPFSFFKWIVYNPSQFNKTELELILNHEKAHAQQYHSIDILLIQLSCILFWFNPFIWLYNKDLKQNLEFIADKTAQKRAISKKSYQYTLLKTSIAPEQLFIVNNFYNSLLKKRITMLHKTESKKINQYKYALIAPLLIAFVFLFNTEVVAQKHTIKTAQSSNKEIHKITKYYQKNDFKNLEKLFKKSGLTFKYSNLKYNSKKELIKLTLKLSREKGSGFVTWEGSPSAFIYIGETNEGLIVTSNKNIADHNNSNNNEPITVIGYEIPSGNQDDIIAIQQKNTI